MTNPARLEIFRAGDHTSIDGVTRTWTPEQIAAIAAAYDPAQHEAPVVVGHPQMDAPALGWIKSLTAQGGSLYADLHQIDPAFRADVEAGRYKKWSAAFYPPDSASNPTPGQWHVRHLGFLGAVPPALKGLRQVSFASPATDAETVEGEVDPAALFPSGNPNPLQENLGMPPTPDPAALAAEEARLDALRIQLEEDRAAFQAERQFQAATAFCEAEIKEGRLLPAEKHGIATLLASLPSADDTAVAFSESKTAKKETPVAFLKRFIGGLPKRIEFGELAGGDEGTEDEAGNPQAEAERLAGLATDYVQEQAAKGKIVGYAEAVRHVKKKGARK